MIDYMRLKSAGNVVLSNPTYVDDSIDTIDVSFDMFDEYSGAASARTYTVKRRDMLGHKQNLTNVKNDLVDQIARIDVQLDSVNEFISDVLAYIE